MIDLFEKTHFTFYFFFILVANTKCTGTMTIPSDVAPGTYHFIWAWAFDQNPAGEEYFTCFDVNVV
jgi:hypothetical protein